MAVDENVRRLLECDRFPRASTYDVEWVLENQMGLHALWLTEWLCESLDLREGMRILDLGCGKALSSIFLAKEYDAQVWATDLWVAAEENRVRIEAAGVGDRVFPIHADARELPYAHEFFDAMVCIDAFIYFGTDDLCLNYLHRFVKKGGQLGMTVPGFMRDLDGPVPEHVRPFWAQECWTWHTVEWWRRHWERTGLVDIEVVDALPEGHDLWRRWYQARWDAGDKRKSVQSDISVLAEDAGRYMGFIRAVARRK